MVVTQGTREIESGNRERGKRRRERSERDMWKDKKLERGPHFLTFVLVDQTLLGKWWKQP